ncbi:MAG: hypothetical protein A2X94_03345 [Bdellovibrionales bacterium GWB1_55_8]|nr:MAG: hypothetical protein A2X94_03345 [Bdellovibrionales bacterium GWB1_55_8]
MLKISLISFALALVAIAFGMAGTAGVSFELGRLVFLILLGNSVLTFIWAVVSQSPRGQNLVDDIPP